MNILIIDGNVQFAHRMQQELGQNGYVASVERTAGHGLNACRSGQYDVLLLDVNLPDSDGVSLVRQLRSEGLSIPAVFVSENAHEDVVVRSLQAGADDYVTKPCSARLLKARIEALLRRTMGRRPVETELILADLRLDLLSRTAVREGRDIQLKPREFLLLEYLMRHANQVVSRDELLENVWGYDFDPQTNVVEVHISRLRAKLDRDFSMQMLKTVRIRGYMLTADRDRSL